MREKWRSTPIATVHRRPENCMSASHLCTNGWEKHHRAFLDVVEGFEMYNFGIHCLEHFSSKIWRNSHLNRVTPNGFGTRPHTRAARVTSRPTTSAPPPYVAIHACWDGPVTTGPCAVPRAPVCGTCGPPGQRHAPHPYDRAAFGHWPAATPTSRHWPSPPVHRAPPFLHATTHCATTLVTPSPRHTRL
jgi:hypothetical protein